MLQRPSRPRSRLLLTVLCCAEGWMGGWTRQWTLSHRTCQTSSPSDVAMFDSITAFPVTSRTRPAWVFPFYASPWTALVSAAANTTQHHSKAVVYSSWVTWEKQKWFRLVALPDNKAVLCKASRQIGDSSGVDAVNVTALPRACLASQRCLHGWALVWSTAASCALPAHDGIRSCSPPRVPNGDKDTDGMGR